MPGPDRIALIMGSDFGRMEARMVAHLIATDDPRMSELVKLIDIRNDLVVGGSVTGRFPGFPPEEFTKKRAYNPRDYIVDEEHYTRPRRPAPEVRANKKYRLKGIRP